MQKLSVAVLIGATIVGGAPATSFAQPGRQGEAPPACRSHVAVGTAVGGGVGGLIGNQLGRNGNREVATALGVVAGAVVGRGLAKAALSECERAMARDAAVQVAQTGRDTQVTALDSKRRINASLADTQPSGSQSCRIVEYALEDDSSPPEQVEVCEVSPGDWRAMG